MNYFDRKKRMAGGGSLWWSLDGYSDDYVLGAWRFINQDSQSDALKDLTKNGRTLSNSGCTWSSANGFYVNNSNYLDHSSLRSSGNMKSIVVKIGSQWAGNYMALSGNWGGISIWLKTPFFIQSFVLRCYGSGVAHGAGTSIDSTSGSADLARENVRIGNYYGNNDVIGFSNSGWGLLYRNGSALSLSNAKYDNHPWTWWQTTTVNIPRLLGGTGAVSDGTVMNGYFYVKYFAVYSKVLSASEHAAIAAKMV